MIRMADCFDLDDPRTLSRVARRLVGQARSRAARADLSFDLDADYVERLVRSQSGRCAVSGVPFSMTTHRGAFVRHPFGPSIDRVSSAQGYTRDNVRLVCVATNFGLGQWGDEVFLVIARGAVEQAKRLASVPEQDHWALLGERIAAAEAVLHSLTEAEQRHQRRRIAAL
jgi:hypothetical protein